MIRNGKTIKNGEVITPDVCVIGSGPAGITAAWYLQKAGLNVTLIEGSREYASPEKNYMQNRDDSRPDKSLLYAGVADGQFDPNERDFPILPTPTKDSPSERERFYGGTSAHWGGQCRPLDPITFEKRTGFPGWPVTAQELAPFYEEAAAFCVLDGSDFSTEHWRDVLCGKAPKLTGFDVAMYQFPKEENKRFAAREFDGVTIARSPIDVILNASLLKIEHADGKVTALSVASMDDQVVPQTATTFTIVAKKAYILACGAVENARQLLLSDAGNEHDQVGRYFMCHPLAPAGTVYVQKPYLAPDELSLMDGDPWTGREGCVPKTIGNGVSVTGVFSPTADKQRELEIGSCWFWAQYPAYLFEMAPNADSRVRLTAENDTDEVFHQRKARITWTFSDLDEKTYARTTEMFKAAVVEHGGVDVTFTKWETVKEEFVVNGHHIGTTRMSSDPENGVVDKNLKVHSLDKLYVAGASVFASAGVSNPTFTIVALSIRLARHLAGMPGA